MSTSVRFRETQRFRQPWLWALLGVVFVVTVPTVVGAIVVAAVGALLYVARLTVEVRDDALLVQFYPLHRSPRRFAPSSVTDVEAVTYRPLREYGGWGIRWGMGGKAYSVSGNRGVRLTRAGGRTLLLGSQRPEELERALEAAIG